MATDVSLEHVRTSSVRLVDHALRWSDIASPSRMISFTFGDAWSALPTLLAMGGFFLAGIFVLVIVRKLLQIVFLGSYTHKYIIDHITRATVNGKPISRREWVKAPTHSYGSMCNLVITSLFLVALAVLAVFTAALGGINIWSSPLASVGIGLIGTYVFGTGLQQIGSYYFVLWFGGMSYNEYWELVGSRVSGRVSRITPFFVEFEAKDCESQSTCMYRVSMTTVLNGQWKRKYKEEMHSAPVSLDVLPENIRNKNWREKQV